MTDLIRTLVLDFDGVLIESNDLKTAAFEVVFARFPEHLPAMMAFHHAHVSESRYVKFEHLATHHLGRAADDPVVQELADAFAREMRLRLIACPDVAGAATFLARVGDRLPVYLASMTPDEELSDLVKMRGWNHYFQHTYGCPPWSKERAITSVIEAHGRDGLVFVGDSAGDQRVAARMAIEFVARDSGLPFDDPRPTAYPDMNAVFAALESRLP